MTTNYVSKQHDYPAATGVVAISALAFWVSSMIGVILMAVAPARDALTAMAGF